MKTIGNKSKIQRAFNSATKSYDQAADWQKEMGDTLLRYLDLITPCSKTILDLGTGTGYLINQMQQRYPNNQFIALDIAESMLRFSKKSMQQHCLCADAENMCLQSGSIDIVISNMMLQWCHSLERTMQEQYTVLKPHGLFIFSVLGENSLQSLKKAWYNIDDYSHVNAFPSPHRIKQAARGAGFSILQFEHHKIIKHYDNVFALMHHLKSTGAKNISNNKPKGLMGKGKISQLKNQYQNPLCYEVYTVICQK